MGINRKDYTREVMKTLKGHKSVNNKFLLRVKIGGIEKQRVITIEPRPAWNFHSYAMEARKEAIKLIDLWNEQIKGASINSSLSIDKTWELFSNTLKDTRSTKQLKAYYEAHIKSKVGFLRLENVKPLHMQSFYNELRQSGLKVKTYNRAFKEILNPLFKFAMQNRAIFFNPCDALKLDKVSNKKIVLNASEKYIRLFKAVMKLYKNEPFYKTLFLLILQGRRRNEALSLQWEQVDLKNRAYIVKESKNGLDYAYKMNDELYHSFLDLKDFWGDFSLTGLIFKSLRTGGKLVNLARQEQKIRDESGVDEWTPHLSRHIITTICGEAGLSGATLSGNLGHKDLSTINTYLTNDSLKASAKVDEVLKKLRE